MPLAQPGTDRRVGAVAAAACLVLLVFACFSPALHARFVNWDDPSLLLENPRFRGFGREHLRWMFTTFHMGHYQPLTWLSFAFDHWRGGLEPDGYHRVNVMLHAANAVAFLGLASVVLRRAEVAAALRDRAAFLAALVFALHPLRVESVAWVTERRDVLSTFFLIVTVLFWLQQFEPSRRSPAIWYGLALVAFTLSLLAKAWGMTLPVVLLLLDVWPLRRAIGLGRALGEKLPFIALAVAAAATAFVAQASVGAMAQAAHRSIFERMLHALYGLGFYVWKSLLPIGLAPAYLLDDRTMAAAPTYALAGVVMIAIAVLLVVRRRWPAGAIAFACYAVLVSPVLGFAQSGVQSVADRYTYVACLPLAVLVAPALARVSTRRGGAVGLAVLLAGLGVLTARQASRWYDSSTLWNHAVAVDPDNWLAYHMRGLALEARGDLDGASADFESGIARNAGYGALYVARGRVRASKGDLRAAMEDFDRAVGLSPGSLEPRLNRGGARLLLGDATGAVEDLEDAVARDPGSALAWYNLASAHAAVGRHDLAVRDCRRALELAPPSGDLRARAERKLAALLAAAGNGL